MQEPGVEIAEHDDDDCAHLASSLMVSHDGAVAHWHWPKVGIHTQASADEHVDVPSAHAASEVRSPHGPAPGGGGGGWLSRQPHLGGLPYGTPPVSMPHLPMPQP